VPSEIEKLYIPIIEDFEHETCKINELIKQGKIEQVMRQQGQKILTRLGFSDSDNEKLMSIWKKLRDRRLRR
jgi:hypothetical protein